MARVASATENDRVGRGMSFRRRNGRRRGRPGGAPQDRLGTLTTAPDGGNRRKCKRPRPGRPRTPCRKCAARPRSGSVVSPNATRILGRHWARGRRCLLAPAVEHHREVFERDASNEPWLAARTSTLAPGAATARNYRSQTRFAAIRISATSDSPRKREAVGAGFPRLEGAEQLRLDDAAGSQTPEVAMASVSACDRASRTAPARRFFSGDGTPT